MNSGQKLSIGNLGEDIAENYLKKKGYKIIGRNYGNKYGEIDLVVQDKSSLVFVEVRTRRNERFSSPEESINNKKRRKMFKNARAYVAFHNFKGKYRIDVICVVLDRNRKIKRINHYQGVGVN